MELRASVPALPCLMPEQLRERPPAPRTVDAEFSGDGPAPMHPTLSTLEKRAI